jgi:DNA mismatch repair ATPase MutS
MFHLWRWHQQHHSEIAGWLDTIAAFDELVSFAGFAGNHPGFVYPEVANGDFVFKSEQLGHPLLPQNKRVGNDFSVAGWSKAVIVTGANMAGKSTFLRTVGVNLILAEAGAPVCAQSMVFTPVQLFTNMRTTDSLQKEESYFFAELKRIKRVLELLENGMPVFVILDEMLKGTNSVDKLNGSKELVKKLLQLPAVSLIATHDLKLSEMEADFPKQVANLCFEIRIENNEMVFDYKLSPGVTQTMNATFLMRKMGII